MDYKKKQAKLIYDILDKFGGDNKHILKSKIEFLLRNQRIRFIKEIERNLDNLNN